ncbi:MAG: MFS transporter [Acutalibacter sp.]|jgi:MFS family permease
MKTKLLTRNFTLLLLGQACSLLGNLTLKFALSMYVLEVTGSAGIFATLLAVSTVPTILLSPLGGILADRLDRRILMISLDLLSGTTVLLAALLMALCPSIPVIACLLVVLSVLSAFESPTVQACIPQMLAGDALGKGNAAVSQIQAVASLVTPFCGSLVYAALGLGPVLWATVGCFYVTALLECFLRLPKAHAPSTGGSLSETLREDISSSVRFLRQEEPSILKLLLLAAAASFFVSGTAVVGFPYLVRTVLGLSAQLYGAAESAMGVAAVAGSLLAGALVSRVKLRWMAWLFLGFGLCLLPCGAAFLLPMGALGRYGVLLAMFCLCQLGCSLFSTWAITVIQSRTPEQLMGKVMSCVFTLSMCAQPVGQLLYGGLFDGCSHTPWLVLLPSGLAVCLLGLWSREIFQSMEKS